MVLTKQFFSEFLPSTIFRLDIFGKTVHTKERTFIIKYSVSCDTVYITRNIKCILQNFTFFGKVLYEANKVYEMEQYSNFGDPMVNALRITEFFLLVNF